LGRDLLRGTGLRLEGRNAVVDALIVDMCYHSGVINRRKTH
jgi:hypothetical protein